MWKVNFLECILSAFLLAKLPFLHTLVSQQKPKICTIFNNWDKTISKIYLFEYVKSGFLGPPDSVYGQVGGSISIRIPRTVTVPKQNSGFDVFPVDIIIYY